ncbi:MAG: hypothetical protein BWK76_09915 [Desulfobulbaceae bacterium A2]|nr:MAG: hypothetical protein BWK76_09915 [Desulfobulbaceae bacterium A2]
MNSEDDINLFQLAWPVTALGPGRRVVLWVAGCRRRCPGCMSPEMRDPAQGRRVAPACLLRHLLRLPRDLDGVTISGGEPFDQAVALTALLTELHRQRPEWTVLVYSGSTLRHLQRTLAARPMLAVVDVLVDGKYQRQNARIHPLAGSGNQRVIPLSSRGESMVGEMSDMPFNQVNFGLGAGGQAMLIGVTDEATRAPLRRAVRGVG